MESKQYTFLHHKVVTYLCATSSDGSSILSAGQWSERDCTKNEVLSNTSVTVCECTHLTHFAILLSAAPLKLADSVTLSLEIIGYVGVAISLVAMTLTVCIFIIIRYVIIQLNSWRNSISPGHSTTCATTSTSTCASALGWLSSPLLLVLGQLATLSPSTARLWLFSSTTSSWCPSCGC